MQAFPSLAERLIDKFDVIVLPDATARSIEAGFGGGDGGERRAANRESGDEERRSAGGAMPPEYQGGLGEPGDAALKEFAAAGGTILAFNKASLYAIQQLGVGARNVLAGVSNRDFYAPGSLFSTTVEPGPLTYGLENQVAVWFESGPAFEPAAEGAIPPAIPVLKYPAGNPLASGWLLGPKLIENKSAVMDAPAGKGHIILFGIRPQYRAQSYATFKLFFNGLFAYQENRNP